MHMPACPRQRTLADLRGGHELVLRRRAPGRIEAVNTGVPLLRAVTASAAAVLAVALGSGAAGQERPLPDLQPFLAQARTRLQTDNERQRSYIYVETQRERKLDGAGRTRSESVKVVESYPPLPGEGERWERVLEEDGKKKTEAEL